MITVAHFGQALAVFWVVLIMSRYRGPLGSLNFVRDRLAALPGLLGRELGELLACFYCLSFWLVLGWGLADGWRALDGLTVLGLSALFHDSWYFLMSHAGATLD